MVGSVIIIVIFVIFGFVRVQSGRSGLGNIYIFYIRLYIRFSRYGNGFVFLVLCVVVETGVLL